MVEEGNALLIHSEVTLSLPPHAGLTQLGLHWKERAVKLLLLKGSVSSVCGQICKTITVSSKNHLGSQTSNV